MDRTIFFLCAGIDQPHARGGGSHKGFRLAAAPGAGDLTSEWEGGMTATEDMDMTDRTHARVASPDVV